MKLIRTLHKVAVCKIIAFFDKTLASLIFVTFGIAQTSLALHSFIAKIGFSVGSWIFGNVYNVDGVLFFCGGKKKTK